jgi:hypothetical protein
MDRVTVGKQLGELFDGLLHLLPVLRMLHCGNLLWFLAAAGTV